MPQLVCAPSDYFDQTQIENMQRAIDRAWQILQQLEPQECSEESRKTLALCVLAEAREGEENQIALVNRAIVKFRAQRAQKAIFARRQASNRHAS